MSSERAKSEAIRTVLGLGGDVQRLDDFYEDWASSYDADLAEEGYRAPQELVDALQAHHRLRAEDRIIDAGCGTGLVGVVLNGTGAGRIDGFDLSEAMVDRARKLGVYDKLAGGVDLNRPVTAFEERAYDVAVSCGVFTSGHVPPEAMVNLLSLVKPGGVCVVSTRSSYCRDTGFDEYCRRQEQEGSLEILACYDGRPYTAHESAQYWVLRVR